MRESKLPSKYGLLEIIEFLPVCGPVEQEELESDLRDMEEPLDALVNNQVIRREKANTLM